jgi:hypothetical protein
MTSRVRTHGAIAVAVVLAVVGAAGFSAAALESQQDQESQRLRQLAVFEELLTETVQERVTQSVNVTIDLARRGDPDGDGIVEDVAAEPLVVKVGRPLAAHGLYVDGYGVMFSIQTPQVSVIPQSFERVLAEPRTVFRLRGATALAGPEVDGVIELRAEMLDRSIDDLIVLLERQPDDLHEIRVQELEGIKITLEGLRIEEVDVHAEAPAAEAADHAVMEVREQRESEVVAAEAAFGRARDLSRRNRWEGYYRDTLAQRDDLKVVLERNHRQVAVAMNAAAIETLASYGALIKGLDDDERIAVVVLPPNTWSFARGFGVGASDDQGEHVVSARYKDIRELDNEKIDYDEFAKRAQIRNRLGLDVIHEDTTEQH